MISALDPHCKARRGVNEIAIESREFRPAPARCAAGAHAGC
jgi:hypothetical protein